MRLGLDDPADTGRLWGVMGPLGAVAQAIPQAEVRIEPEFGEPVLDFETRGQFSIIPLQLIILSMLFVFSPSSLRGWYIIGRKNA